MKDFFQLKKNLKKDFSGLKKIKIAVLGDTSTQFLVEAIRGLGFDQGLDVQVWEADFDQIENQVFDSGSELYKSKPEFVILFKSSHKLLNKYNKLKTDAHHLLASNELSSVENIYSAITKNLNANIIFYNYAEINDSVFGNFANKTETSFLFQLRKLNLELMNFAAQHPDFNLGDLSTLQNLEGRKKFFQPSVYINTEMVLSIDILPKVAAKTLDIINAVNGKLRKCVILDLDNTLWGGTIGDDGMENIQLGSLGNGKAFTEFQYWLKKLRNRGIILAVCSKNTESVAKEPFERHPDMILQMEDFAVFVSNWENKADNIRHIQNVLNIGFDSMVFIDDNPFERNIVRVNIPEICVPEMPEDPAEYLEYLYSLNLFETASYSGEDANRTALYQVESKRITARQSFTNEDDYLKSLNMVSVVEPFIKFNIPRVSQLSQRSNQFNLRTVRYTDTDAEKLSGSDQHLTFAFTLEDKFGDNGLICVVVLQIENQHTMFIENWFMSCRVLKRGMEHFVLNTIADFARDNGYSQLKGEYIPTAKNEIVKDHFMNLGFEKTGTFWILDTLNYKNKKCFIHKK
jgi:FkbH-like protein